jgi:HEAT repeat protein
LATDIVEHLKQIAIPGQPFEKKGLRVFSNLDSRTIPSLWPVWLEIARDRRCELVKALLLLAEENVDVDFRELFVMCFDDPDPTVRAVAVEGVWEDENPLLLRRLLKLVDDPASEVRSMVMAGLSRFAYMSAVGNLAGEHAATVRTTLFNVAVDSDQPLEVRRRAVESMGYFSDSAEVQREVGRAYEHSNQHMRESALVAMGRSMLPEWAPYIRRELQSTVPALRYEAARAVGEYGEDADDLVDAVLPLVDDADTDVSLAAIWALGQAGGFHGSAHRVLQRVLLSDDPARAEAADAALWELSLYDDESL